MRGKVVKLPCNCPIIGITPAYAGKRHADPDTVFRHQDHPRLCGEKLPWDIYEVLTLGSPPPMRGKVQYLIILDTLIRITPAYAGKSDLLQASEHCQQDHPRLCGEKSPASPHKPITPGSPPPMRGKGYGRGSADPVFGITPAYAGKSTWKYMPFVTSQDHPRLCGEKFS